MSRSTKGASGRLTHVSGFVVILNKWWSAWFGRQGVFGLESVFFDVVFLTREFVEIALQSFQARQTSEMIATVWLNRFFILLVVTNCWTTPLVQRVFRHHQALARLSGITIDLALTMGTNMVIPAIIFLPYLKFWRAEKYSFDAELLYDDLWFSNMVMENRLLFARSPVDFVSKFVPHVSILICLSCIKTLVVRASGSYTHGRAVVPVADNTSPPQAPTINDIPPLAPRTPASIARFRLNGWKTLIVHTILVLWGFTLLSLHISASLAADHDEFGGCKQSIRVWFATKSTCTTYEYNCFRRHHDLDLVSALNGIEPTTLVSLIISHCNDLVVPAEIRHFRNLLSFELFNVTLRDWPASAAISPDIHTGLVALLLVYVNMTALPDGVRGEIPESLSDIEIAYTNLTTLPDDLHESWHALDVLYLEYSPVRDFPVTLTQLAVYDLSLIGNQLETVPRLAELSVEMYTLALSYNPLQALPATIDERASFGYLVLEHTRLATLPVWVNDAGVLQETAFARGTPVCGDKDDDADAPSAASDSSSSLPSRVPLDRVAWPHVECEASDPRSGGRYPLAVMLPRRVV